MGLHPGSDGGSDSNKSANSLVVDDEFFDAVDAEIDKEIEQHKHSMLPESSTFVEDTPGNSIPRLLSSSHPIYADVCHSSRVSQLDLKYLYLNIVWVH